jgi:L-fuculose-phosphate aldolase
MNEIELRAELLRTVRKLDKQGLNRGTSGNVSARCGTGFLVTPSGVGIEALTEADLVLMDFAGNASGCWQPSSEWLFHRDILAARPEVHAVVHTHSTAATAMACLRREIPPFHYMVATVGGNNIRCADYATFGTQELSDAALRALKDRKACLLANHGMIALGASLAEAFKMAVEVESLCEQYWRALQVGQPVLLTPEEFEEAQKKFVTYGKPAGKPTPT